MTIDLPFGYGEEMENSALKAYRRMRDIGLQEIEERRKQRIARRWRGVYNFGNIQDLQ